MTFLGKKSVLSLGVRRSPALSFWEETAERWQCLLPGDSVEVKPVKPQAVEPLAIEIVDFPIKNGDFP